MQKVLLTNVEFANDQEGEWNHLCSKGQSKEASPVAPWRNSELFRGSHIGILPMLCKEIDDQVEGIEAWIIQVQLRMRKHLT
jgi:hypothetical protein